MKSSQSLLLNYVNLVCVPLLLFVCVHPWVAEQTQSKLPLSGVLCVSSSASSPLLLPQPHNFRPGNSWSKLGSQPCCHFALHQRLRVTQKFKGTVCSMVTKEDKGVYWAGLTLSLQCSCSGDQVRSIPSLAVCCPVFLVQWGRRPRQPAPPLHVPNAIKKWSELFSGLVFLQLMFLFFFFTFFFSCIVSESWLSWRSAPLSQSSLMACREASSARSSRGSRQRASSWWAWRCSM